MRVRLDKSICIGCNTFPLFPENGMSTIQVQMITRYVSPPLELRSQLSAASPELYESAFHTLASNYSDTFFGTDSVLHVSWGSVIGSQLTPQLISLLTDPNTLPFKN